LTLNHSSDSIIGSGKKNQGALMKSLHIGQVAGRVGCTVETIRLYEKKGLLAQPARELSGYRLYEEDDIAGCDSSGRQRS
jgi:hypothetical protein